MFRNILYIPNLRLPVKMTASRRTFLRIILYLPGAAFVMRKLRPMEFRAQAGTSKSTYGLGGYGAGVYPGTYKVRLPVILRD
jgi:hypothetical protein